MTTVEKEAALMLRGCAIVEDAGDFALVYPYGYQGRKRAHDLAAKTREAAIVEAWDYLHPEEQMAERIEIIQRVIAADFGVDYDALLNGGKAEPNVTARQIAMAICRKLTPAPLTLIGAAFGGRNHTTVINAEQTIADRADTDERFSARFNSLLALCVSTIAEKREKGAA